MEHNPPTLQATETSENNGKTVPYIQTSEEEIFKEVNNNNKLLVIRKWKVCQVVPQLEKKIEQQKLSLTHSFDTVIGRTKKML